MKKRGIIVLLGLILLVSFVLAYVGTNAHSPDNVLLEVNGYSMTLQQAVDNNFLNQFSSDATENLILESEIGNETHLGNEVYISVNGQNMNLSNAINQEERLCSKGYSDATFTEDIAFGHLGEEINIEIDGDTKSLQQAINNEDFCCQQYTCEDLGKECGVHDNGCQGTIDCGGCEEDNYACNEDGFCRLSCNDECSSGSTRCLNGDTRQTCGDYDSDLCLEWGNSRTCTGCKTCSGGSCVDNDNQCGDYEECNNGVCYQRPSNIDFSSIDFSTMFTHKGYKSYVGCVDVEIDCRKFIGTSKCKINWDKIGMVSELPGAVYPNNWVNKGESYISKGQVKNSGEYFLDSDNRLSCFVKWSSDNIIKVYGKNRKSSSYYTYQKNSFTHNNIQWYIL